MAAVTVFTRNTQQLQFQGMLMGLEFSEPRRFMTTFYGDRSKVESLAKKTGSFIVDDVDAELS